MHTDIRRDISVAVNCKGDEHKGLGKNIEGYPQNLLTKQVIFRNEGSPGEIVART